VTKAGESLTLTNQTGKTVVVIGYAGEAYLGITPTGVDENVASLSSSLNGSLIIEGLPQPQEQPNQQRPDWRHVSDRPTFTWHDHRIHWIAQQRPPVVAGIGGVELRGCPPSNRQAAGGLVTTHPPWPRATTRGWFREADTPRIPGSGGDHLRSLQMRSSRCR
jgi:hypothetical protein